MCVLRSNEATANASQILKKIKINVYYLSGIQWSHTSSFRMFKLLFLQNFQRKHIVQMIYLKFQGYSDFHKMSLLTASFEKVACNLYKTYI